LALSTSFFVLSGTFALAVVIQRESQILLEIAPAAIAVPMSVVTGFVQKSDYLGWRLLIEAFQLRRANAFMNRVAMNMQDGLVTLHPDGRIDTTNLAASHMLGLPSMDLQGQKVSRYLVWPRTNSLAAVEQYLQAASLTDTIQRVICCSVEGEKFYAEVSVAQLPEALSDRWIIVIRDATDKVRADRLARRRERDLRALKIKAEVATRAKTEFVATMSHELRTPLNAIVGSASIISNEQFGELNQSYKAFADEIVQGGARLERLLSHVLDYANAEMDLTVLERDFCDLFELLREAVGLQQKRAEVAGVEITLLDPGSVQKVFVDRVAMQKAIGNILANAIRFSSADGQVKVTLETELSGRIEIKVEDQGIGIPNEVVKSCFEPFFQVDQSARRALDGAGLGLTVAQRFVRMHGGDVTLQSELDIGTTATITLPTQAELTSLLESKQTN
jgi:PAS domain S-box-containing protein